MEYRFIPTCVGQIIWNIVVYIKDIGSSPHAWGRWLKGLWLYLFQRFIPTCVGQMSMVARISLIESVHPHMRGADVRNVPAIKGFAGSSPHAWGRFRVNGIPVVVFSVHPHMRGADDRVANLHIIGFGSSPHAWGR